MQIPYSNIKKPNSHYKTKDLGPSKTPNLK
jgi:hypothetical protein